MSGNNILREKLLEKKQFETKIGKRTFGQSEEEELDTQLTPEQVVIKEIKEKINKIYGQRILVSFKETDFKLSLSTTIMKLLSNYENFSDITRRKKITQQILDDILGFGPIQDLIEDPSITEIMVSRWDKVYAEKKGKLQLIPNITFNNEEHLRNVIDSIVQPLGRRIDESEPLVDARLPDGSRVNATIRPISPDGATLTVRKFSKNKLTGEDYLKFGSLSKDMLDFLKAAVAARCNIIVAGGTGSGKTTLLNMLSNFIPQSESIVTIEDSCELRLYQDNVRRLEARSANVEGKGAIPIRRLVKNVLRMRPDRIIVGEIRDGCVVDMFRAMSSGHDGTQTTVHTNSPKDLVEGTLPILFGMSDMKMTETAQKHQIALAIDLIVQISRFKDGSRKISNITHVIGLGKECIGKVNIKEVDKDKIYLQDIFNFKQKSFSNGKVTGDFNYTGYKPQDIIVKIENADVPIPKIFKKINN